MTPGKPNLCDHQLHARLSDESLAGSWAEELTFDHELGQRLRISCCACGKFYGFAPANAISVSPQSESSEFRKRDTESESVKTQNAISKLGEDFASKSPDSPLIDFVELRRRTTIRQVLELLEWHPVNADWERNKNQLRGRCPIHHGCDPRSFSVNVRKNIFRCFKPSCDAQGNQLDLYAIATGQQIYQAAAELCQRLGVELPTK